ncbi:MAG TPA: hypothetical protein VHY58_15240 [Streptosporangiaceae bacterium]|jgi:hypothetical protein|nr:hypothetical protein [Streptosporangiaceae bacterium]
MKGSRIALAVAAAVAIALPGGAALAATGHTQPAANTFTARTVAKETASRTSGSSHQTVILTCLRKGQVRPGSYVIACGDGSEYLSGLRWSSWTPGEATATGRFSLNNCTPNCAQGKYSHSDVLVVLWHATAWPHHAGQRAFGRMTVIYTGKRPAHTAQTFTQTLWYPVIK